MKSTNSSSFHTDMGEAKAPSVSKVLDKLYPFNPGMPDKDFYLARGTYIHKCCELHLKEQLNDKEIPVEIRDDIMPYLDGYKLYVSEYGLQKKDAMTEELMHHKIWGYRFKPDTYFKRLQILDDIKTNSYFKDRYKMQLIAYREGLLSWGYEVDEMRTVLLLPGKYKILRTRHDQNKFRLFIKAYKKLKNEEVK